MGDSDKDLQPIIRQIILNQIDHTLKTACLIGCKNTHTMDYLIVKEKIPTINIKDVTFPRTSIEFIDINKRFEITGYDFVGCFRTLHYGNNRLHLLEQLNILKKNNKKIMFDICQLSKTKKRTESMLQDSEQLSLDCLKAGFLLVETVISPEGDRYDYYIS